MFDETKAAGCCAGHFPAGDERPLEILPSPRLMLLAQLFAPLHD